MNKNFMKIKEIRFLILTILIGLTFQAQISFAQTKSDGDDAKTYSEIKTVIECEEKSMARGLKPPTQEDAEDKNCPSLANGAAYNPNGGDINFDDLLAKSDLLVNHNPNMTKYYLLRGKVRYYKSVKGFSMFDQTLIISEPDYLANFSPADIAAGIKDFSDALTVNPATKLDQYDAAAAHRFRGKLSAVSAAKSYSKQLLQNALIDFDEAVKLDGYELPPNDFRKAIYVLSKDGDLVGQDFARRIKENPSDAQSFYLERAGYYSLVVNYGKALADLLRYANSPNSDQDVAGIRYAILNKYAGEAYKKSNLSTAQDYVEKASFEIQFPQNAEAAFNDATQAEKLNPHLTTAYVIRAKYLVGTGKVDEGKSEAYFALLQDPDNVEALCIRALGSAIKNDFTNSLDDFNRAIALDPELAFLYNAFGNRAKIYTALGKADLAAADTEKNTQLAQKLGEIRK